MRYNSYKTTPASLPRYNRSLPVGHRVRDGTLERTQFIAKVEPIRQAVHDLLTEAADYTVADGALWLFVTVEGIEPTNNAAEQVIRPAVLWRKCSYGSQSAQGSLFVGRIVTVVTSLRRQQRHVLDYLSEACRAKRQGLPAPSLLPISNPVHSLLVP